MSEGAAAARYEQLRNDREPYLMRAREAASLTLPSLIPPEGNQSGRRFYTPHNSVPARGINNLASKIMLTMLPPNIAFFRLVLEPVQQIKLNQLAENNPEAKKLFDEGFGDSETIISKRIDLYRPRPKFFVAVKHLIVGGNALMFFGKNATKLFALPQYVTLRDPDGSPVEIVVAEEIYPEMIKDEQTRRAALDWLAKSAGGRKTRKTVTVYTHVVRGAEKWTEYQEVAGKKVPGTEGQYPLDSCPWLPLRWEVVDGENYGRGLVEQFLGDVATLESLWKALVDNSLAAAKILYGVKPGYGVKKKDLEKSSGSVIDGDLVEGVTVLQLEKYADLNVATMSAERVEKRLEQTFLLNSSVTRQAERVTAEEIRFMANELETALGGVYTVLSTEFQLPLVKVAIADLEREKALPDLANLKGVDVVVVTGVDALGRNQELMRLDSAVDGFIERFGEASVQFLNPAEYLRRRLRLLSVEDDGLVKTPAEIQAEQQQAAMANMADKAAAPVAGAIAQAAVEPQQTQ